MPSTSKKVKMDNTTAPQRLVDVAIEKMKLKSEYYKKKISVMERTIDILDDINMSLKSFNNKSLVKVLFCFSISS